MTGKLSDDVTQFPSLCVNNFLCYNSANFFRLYVNIVEWTMDNFYLLSFMTTQGARNGQFLHVGIFIAGKWNSNIVMQ